MKKLATTLLALSFLGGTLCGCTSSEKKEAEAREKARQEAFCSAVEDFIHLDRDTISNSTTIDDHARVIYNNAPPEDRVELEPTVSYILSTHKKVEGAANNENFWEGMGTLLGWTGLQVATNHPYGQAVSRLEEYAWAHRC
ncbi:hypothetical protein [Corynebacterium sp. UBA2622]|uniref:hypothetical protein n=1 Tax=Corynebacterium sp. UBA2622 TaxID=1946393 RepID=UPI0025BE2877|nr:hypothetical protein [Corynebacterium sp. UBA2622]